VLRSIRVLETHVSPWDRENHLGVSKRWTQADIQVCEKPDGFLKNSQKVELTVHHHKERCAMFNAKELLGALMQGGGLTRSSGNRVEHAFGERGVGQSGGILGQLLGGSSGGAGTGGGGILGNLANMAQSMFGDANRSLKSGNPAAIGGLGALAGAILGRGKGGSTKGALGMGTLAMLGSLAYQALQKNTSPQSAGSGQAVPASELPLGLRAPANAVEEQELESQSVLILRAMINAAKADGQIDPNEMKRIVGKVQEEGVDPEEKEFIESEMRRPLDLDGLIREVPNQQVGAKVYAASLLAIEVDTPAERDYLRRLAQGLGLDSQVVQQLHTALGVD